MHSLDLWGSSLLFLSCSNCFSALRVGFLSEVDTLGGERVLLSGCFDYEERVQM